MVAPKVKAFNEPSFATGEAGTLHGARTDANGYKFLRIRLYGSPEIKTFKGCEVAFSGSRKSVKLKSDTKEIESYYSQSLKKGITEFEVYLSDEDLANLKMDVDTITIDFGKAGFFKRLEYSFRVDAKKFAAFL